MGTLNKVLKAILYSQNIISRFIYRVYYRKWLYRFNNRIGFISSNNILNHLSRNQIFRYHEPERVIIRQHYSIDEEIPNQFSYYINKTFDLPAGETYIFMNAFLIGPEAVGLTESGEIILDTALDEPDLLHKASPNLIMNYEKIETEQTFDCAISLVNIFCNNHYVNYYHFITDSLILLEGVKTLEKEMNLKIKLIVNENLNSFQTELIQILGYHVEDLFYWKYKKVKVHKLIVVKSRKFSTEMDKLISPSGLNWLRNNLIKSKLNGNENRRIYVSRQDASCRRILNEEAFLKTIQKYGFMTINLNNASIKEQIDIFTNAEMIISVHGAALTNIIFSQNIKIIELLANIDSPRDHYWYDTYFILAGILDHQYSFMECTAQQVFPNEMRQFYDLHVDNDKLEIVIKEFLS